MVKIATYSGPQIVLNEDGATAAQSIILEVFPTNTDVRPFFSLGIVSSSVCSIEKKTGEVFLSIENQESRTLGGAISSPRERGI